ncbi:MAG: PEP-CTERM sorting domain-containing protein [Armatimonadota bacterium]
MRLSSVIVCMLVLFLAGSVSGDSIAVMSGNAAIGALDPLVSVVGAPVMVGGVSYPAADVAQQQALVITKNSVWVDAAPGSKWVGVANGTQSSPRYGYIYSTTFSLPENYDTPLISMVFACDDGADAYLNGHLIGSGGHLEVLTNFGTSNSAFFNSGLNVLQFYAHNNVFVSFNPSGLTFSGIVTYSPNAVPEPSSFAAILSGISVTCISLRKKKRQRL